MPLSLVIGANGQDGSYMVEHLVSVGDQVVGVDIHPKASKFAPRKRYKYRQLDLRVAGSLSSLLANLQPDKVFHLSAIHGPTGFAYEPVWRAALEVNTISVQEVLEYARDCGSRPMITYASSSKVFGDNLKGIVTESSPKKMDNLYAVTKLAAEGVIHYYRVKHGVNASVVYYFNHESSRRGSGFFPRLLAEELNKCLHNSSHTFEVNTLSFYCDWGASYEYMEITNQLMTAAAGEDFIVATGHTWLGHDLVRELWKRFGLDPTKHIKERFSNVPIPQKFEASLHKMKRFINRTPVISAVDICEEMVKELQR